MSAGPDSLYILRAAKLRSRPDQPPKGYRHTVALIEEGSGSQVAYCHVCGELLHAPQAIEIESGQRWGLRPNRKIMPSNWTLSEPDGQAVLVLDQRIFGKLVSPLTRVGMSIEDLRRGARYRVVEPQASVPEKLLGPDPDAWAVEGDDGTVALIASLPKTPEAAGGWRARLQRFLQGMDMGLVSLGAAHQFGPAQSLAILMIFRELRDISHSVD